MQTQISPIMVWSALGIGAAGLLLSAYALFQLSQLAKLKKIFLSGKNGNDLEEVLQYLAQSQHSLQAEQQAFAEHLSRLSERLGFAIQRVGVVRFNPFEDGGGNFSFCVALLDGHNNGVVLTSMHGRQQHRIYSKRVTHGTSDHPLTEEEVEAIRFANTK